MRRLIRRPARAAGITLLAVALALGTACGESPNDERVSDARSQADGIVEAAPAAYAGVVGSGDTSTEEGRDRIRAEILLTTDALISRVSAPFDRARSEARAAGEEDDERFDRLRREQADLILDAQDAALARIDALDDAEDS